MQESQTPDDILAFSLFIIPPIFVNLGIASIRAITMKAQPQQSQPATNLTSPIHPVPVLDFETWAKAVRQQMMDSLQRRL
ncbi:MAG: hypothetical protein MUF49_00240 [Oculatellaceae cyanobacterium Prado106]|jgi:hypothetical protein|nr:hypothetical protein [Oculatellaceae cyanobacterium Prado106]